IREAVAFGNGRDYVCAFINIDMGSVGNWAERRGIAYSGYTDLAAKPDVYSLIRECVEQVNAELAAESGLVDSQIRRFLILHKELDPDDDELTRTRKVRRGFVAAAASDVDGSLRIRAKRTGAQDSQRRVVIDVFDRHDTLGRHALLHPALERAQDVVFRVMVQRSRLRQRLTEGVWTGATSTVRHPGRHEQPEERSIARIRVGHLLEVVDRAQCRNRRIFPAVPHDDPPLA